MLPRRPTERPEGILQAFGQGNEALTAKHDVGVREPAIGQTDVIETMIQRCADLSPVMRRLVGARFADLRRLEERIRELTQEIEAVADREDVTRRLMTIPGIGALGATAVLAAIGDGLQFRKARDLAAWLGLVPRQYSSGGKQTLLGVSKRGNRYLRKLLVQGARSCFRHLDRTRDRLGSWLDGLQARMHPNKAVVALAAKMARIVWVVLNKPGALYERRDPALPDASGFDCKAREQ
ncbi:hypothetical protein GCM10010987_79560 [Bradyrhizobium guangdongense]|uniref:Transposase IS116/IS110/IS902 C-terminal domain-containing protein n=1 Tax=Bradyrhizobium guangdongense TaxID=1325090 RepID=A0AA87WH45_9BRAD|nr:hypothetical protein GCM10010987_79560 [Bradyrhizobium guangdongense]